MYKFLTGEILNHEVDDSKVNTRLLFLRVQESKCKEDNILFIGKLHEDITHI